MADEGVATLGISHSKGSQTQTRVALARRPVSWCFYRIQRPSSRHASSSQVCRRQRTCQAFLSKATAKWSICRARSMVLQDPRVQTRSDHQICSGSQEEQLKTFFAWAKEPKLASRCKGQEMTGIQAPPVRQTRHVDMSAKSCVTLHGLQVCGQDVQQQVQAVPSPCLLVLLCWALRAQEFAWQDALTLTGMATGAKNIRIIPEKDAIVHG